MTADVLRKQVRIGFERLNRARQRLTRLDPKKSESAAERGGLSFVDGLRRRPNARAEWGMRRWDDRERDRMANFAEDLIATVAGEKSELDAGSVVAAKAMLRISQEDDLRLRAAGVDIGAEIQSAVPTFMRVGDLVEDATDEELFSATWLCGQLADEEKCRDLTAGTGLPSAIADKLREVVGFGGSRGVLTVVFVVRQVRAAVAARDAAASGASSSPPSANVSAS